MRCRSDNRVFLDEHLSPDEKVYLLVCFFWVVVMDGRVLRSAAGSLRNGRALGDSRACLACKCTRVSLFYLEKRKRKNSAVFSSRHKVFLWLRAAGCRPV